MQRSIEHELSASRWPRLGFGVGLRAEHYQEVLSERPSVEWFEAITENYMDTGGRPLHVLESLRQNYPVALHGLALSIGSVDPIDSRYLRRLRDLVERLGAHTGGYPARITEALSEAYPALRHVLGGVGLRAGTAED